MADNDAQIKFTFSAEGFQQAIESITKSLEKLTEHSTKTAQETGKGMFNAMLKFQILKTAITTGFNGAMSAIKTYIPEIGSTFDIAGRIIMKNLLWPLRQELIPMLQKVLTWVTTHRKFFAELGTVLVNVFKLIKQVFSSLAHLVEPLIAPIKSLLKNIFGDSVKSITQAINMAIFKITFFVMTLESILQPIGDAIGGLFDTIIKNTISFAKNFIDGFKAGFANTNFDVVKEITQTLRDLRDVLRDFKPLGDVFSKVFGFLFSTAFKVTLGMIKDFLEEMDRLYRFVTNPKEFIKDTAINAMLDESRKKLGDKKYNEITGGKDLHKGGNYNDVIITKQGQIIKTSPDDNIFATKGSMGGKGVNLHIDVGGITIQVTEGNAKEAGKNFMEGMEFKARNILLNNAIVSGVY